MTKTKKKKHHQHHEDPPAIHATVGESVHVESMAPTAAEKEEFSSTVKIVEDTETNSNRSKSSPATSVVGNDEKKSNVDDDEEEEDGNEKKGQKTEDTMKVASIWEVFSYGSTNMKVLCLSFGLFFAALSGAVPIGVIIYFSTSFTDLVSVTTTDDDPMKQIRELAYAFLVLGVIALISTTGYATFLETSAGYMTQDFKKKWFQALLRQDMAYFDIQDVSGVATLISSNGAKYKRGVGLKLGLLVQFTVTFLGGLGYAFYASWQTALVVLCTAPFMAVSGWFLVKMTTTTTQRANAAYAEAGGIVYTSISAIRTILSLNAVAEMVDKFIAATEKAFKVTSSQAGWLGLAQGSMNASFLLSSVVVPLYGGYLLWSQVTESGCDPSGGFPGATTCSPEGSDIFGAMFGVFTAASVLPQMGTITESFTQARAAVYLAHEVMDRKLKSDEEEGGGSDDDDVRKSPEHNEGKDFESSNEHVRRGDGNFPEYRIDSSSPKGLKPEKIDGDIDFVDVTFSYPTRQERKVFDKFNLSIKAGKSVAIVGPSGSGKSTLVQLLERNYDVLGGSIKLDGNDLRDMNIKCLRQHLGYISQEPKLFACSIRENIAFGAPGATFDEIVAAAKAANAHEFITSFPDQYETNVGDMGGQLSGGQRQRIAIARVLVRNPSVLLLDEATSALDTESESQVQASLDKLMQEQKRTTIIIAHRLTTVKNADIIAVVEHGKVVESGTHSELMAKEGEYFKLVEAQTHPSKRKSIMEETGESGELSRRSSAVSDEDEQAPILRFNKVAFHYPTRPDKQIFRKLHLSVHRGETLALVGPSGHGKSSIIQLIERFYDPNEGSIELNGVNLKDINVSWLHDQIGLVSQEPTLFDASISENVRFGCRNATQEEIEDACRKANIHETIMGFPDQYETNVNSGASISGGQKQRICIARALLRRPKILLLDEATSALDSQSESIVQKAIDDITTSSADLTTIMIAHRLSSIQKADRIAVIYEGRVKEIGTHDELMAKPKGIYRKLQAFSDADQGASVVADASKKRKKGKKGKGDALDEDELASKETDKSRERSIAKRARMLAQDDWPYFLVGGIGALLVGAVFPAWGFIFAYTIELLYTPVAPCDAIDAVCKIYWNSVKDTMQDLASSIAWGSFGTMMAAFFGNILLYYGFGVAVERMNRRVRNEMFQSLIRQEVGYFDSHNVGSLTAQLQDDAAMVQSFTGEPIRSLIVSLSSVCVGLVVGFIYMWEFALLFIGILPFMVSAPILIFTQELWVSRLVAGIVIFRGFGAEMEMRMYMTPPDEGDDSVEEKNSPGGIVIESLLNVRTISALTMEEMKLEEYSEALHHEEAHPWRTNCIKGSGAGLGQFFQNWGLALMFWFGGYLLNEGRGYDFRDFLIAMMALFFSLYGLTVAFEGATDRAKASLAAERIFSLTDRVSSIDPLKNEGQCPDDAFITRAIERKSSKKGKHKKHSSKKLLVNQDEINANLSGDHESKPSSKKHKKKKKHHDKDHDEDHPGDSEKPTRVKKHHKRKTSKKIIEESKSENGKPTSGGKLTKSKSHGKDQHVDEAS